MGSEVFIPMGGLWDFFEIQRYFVLARGLSSIKHRGRDRGAGDIMDGGVEKRKACRVWDAVRRVAGSSAGMFETKRGASLLKA